MYLSMHTHFEALCYHAIVTTNHTFAPRLESKVRLPT